MTDPTTSTPAADAALKAKHRALWASGDYSTVAAELISSLGPELVRACGITAGERVLDVAAGAGNVALPAAAAGALVTASDLTPELLDVGRAQAQAGGLELEWVVADAESMPFADNSFDVVVSSVGVMFAPHHQAAADELIRVVRPGGRIGLINWTPGGFIGQLLATMKPFVPAPPPGASPAPLWGDRAHVTELFGDRLENLEMRTQTVRMNNSGSPLEFREFWKSNYGPTISAYKANADDPQRVAELDAAFLAFLESARVAGSAATYDAEYLLVTATKRSE